MEMFLESCCVSLEQVKYAQAAGARRIELCENLAVGGVTPSRELLAAAIKVADIPVNVLVRPRDGDFCFNEAEILQMLDSIDMCHELGANAVVIGALDADGNVDMPTMRRLISRARSYGLKVTFHRAFDVCADPMKAFDDILELGCDRLLTSGHEADAYEGRFMIAELVRRAGDRIVVMAGCGVRPNNIKEIVALSKCTECHASASFFK